MFEIYRYSPIYCQITDGLIGTRSSRANGMVYSNEKLAHKLAGRMQREDFDGYGDDHFGVVRVGDEPFTKRRCSIVEPLDDNIPF